MNIDISNLNILVTGGAGFIGSNIVEHLLNNGVKFVRVLDNLSTGYKKNIEPLLEKHKNLEFMYGDVANLETCRKAMKNIDVVCNPAALGSVPRSIVDSLNSHMSNVNRFFNILLAAKENSIKRVVYASSSTVYGDSETLPKVEYKVGEVLSPYAANKKINEIYANVFCRVYKMECIGLRYFNVFGPRQDPNGAYAAVIPKFIDAVKKGNSPHINGDGSFSRDFTYIDNIVGANIQALTTSNEKCFGEVFNIGAGGRFTILEMLNVIKEVVRSDVEPVFDLVRDGDIPHSNANVSKAGELLGYEVKVDFAEGIKKTVEFYVNN